MADTALDFLLENMMQLINCSIPSMICLDKEKMLCIYEEMQFLRKFIMDSVKARTEFDEVRDLVAKIRDVTHEVEDIIDSLILLAFAKGETMILTLFLGLDLMDDFVFDSYSRIHKRLMKVSHIDAIKSFVDKRVGHGFGGILEEINSVKTKVREIYVKNMYGIGVLQQTPNSSVDGASASSIATGPVVVQEETVVGMDDDIISIIEQLTAEHQMHLKLIPIIGMPGLGKTTMARKVYEHPFVAYHFHVRAWTFVSQEFQKRDLLLSISRSLRLVQSLAEIDGKREEELGEKLYKGLKGKRYLIVLDDVWDVEVWNDLKGYFPDDNNGSRVVFTSRHVDVALHAKPYYLRFLNQQESWDLLQKKAFGKQTCPPELIEIGEKIAEKCLGLPLAILIVSGLLMKNDKTLDWWRHVADSVSSYITSEPEQYMATLGLSYNHLPFHLKPCFLYFGAFREDYEIPVPKLFWLWIAEGFIRKNEQKSLEEVAEGYLMDLVDRSLVAVSKRRTDGGIKTCRVHDLLRDLCLRKAEEENFLMLISRFEHVSPLLSSSHIVNKVRRISIHSQIQCCEYLKDHGLHVRSFLSFQYAPAEFCFLCASSICHDFKLLKVLDLSSMELFLFPAEMEFLVHLRYLSLGAFGRFQPSISNLWNLETFIVNRSTKRIDLPGGINLPDGIWKMLKLRHLHIKPYFSICSSEDGYPFRQDNLQSINGANLREGDEQVLACMPNIRRLKCQWNQSVGRKIHFPKLDFLIHLEKLSLSCDEWQPVPVTLPSVENFPLQLRCLTLSNLHLPWEKISIFGRLLNLEVLKLSRRAFSGSIWDTRDGEFRKLRSLKLQSLDIKKWNASASHFPILQTLVLDFCQELEEIPSGFGDISTLEMIRISYCGRSAANSAQQIQKLQQSMGNDGLAIHLEDYPAVLDN